MCVHVLPYFYVLLHATGRKIIPQNLGLARRGDKGDGFRYALSVTSDYKLITWKRQKIYTADVTAGWNSSVELLNPGTHSDLDLFCYMKQK